MNYLKIYCAIGTGYMYLQLLERFTGRHVGDCLLSCAACHVHSVVVVLLLDRHIYPCHSWPSLSSQSCWALFWYLVVIVTRIFVFLPEILLLSTRNPSCISLFEASLLFPVWAIPLSGSRTALNSCTWSSCWWLKFCHLYEGRHATHKKGETVPGDGKKYILIWTFWT